MVSRVRQLDVTTAVLRKPTKNPQMTLAARCVGIRMLMFTGRSPAMSLLAGGYREGPKYFFQPQVDSK